MSSASQFPRLGTGLVSRYVDERLDSGEKYGENMARINAVLCAK
jgi:hypothetical protein